MCDTASTLPFEYCRHRRKMKEELIHSGLGAKMKSPKKIMISYKPSGLLLRLTMVITGISVLGLVTVSILYATRMSNIGRELPDTMEGKATLNASSDAGGVRVYHIKVDFNKKLVQFSLSEKTTSGIVATKIIVHDYNTGRSHFILSQKGTSTSWCIYTDLRGEMISKKRHATLQSVDLNLPNATIQWFSKTNYLKFADYDVQSCIKHIEGNFTFDEAFSKIEYADKTKLFGKDCFECQNQMNTSRSRRGIGVRNGRLDWWYGNWCGAKQGGYQSNPKPSCKRLCRKSTRYITSACRRCLPPTDRLDQACMEHDRCIQNLPRGPRWCQLVGNPCSCDRPFVRKVRTLKRSCSTSKCRSNANQVDIAFRLLSCWYNRRVCSRGSCRTVKRCSFRGSAKI